MTVAMEPRTLYALLVASCVAGCLLAMVDWDPARRVRNLTVLACYFLLIPLLMKDPAWRVACVWAACGLATGLACYVAHVLWVRSARHGPHAALADRDNPWWLIPLGLLGWPDMLAQTIEFAFLQRQRFGSRP